MGCGESNSHGNKTPKTVTLTKTYQGSYPIRVTCTTGMVADLVRKIGGRKVEVEQLMGADVDPHTYQATARDVAKLGGAELIFYNGLHLEGKMGEIFESLSRKIPAFGIGEYLAPKKVFGERESEHDPHIWFDVQLWSEAGGVVAEVLQKFDPSTKSDYEARLKDYQAKLAELHEYAKKEIATIPKEQRVLVTSHDAFRYFGRAYDIEVKGIQGISTEAEASVRDINDLVTFIVKRKIKAVFVESSVNPKNMRSVMEGAAANGHKVVIGGELFSDAMGKEGTAEGTYIGMVRHNVNTIVKALK
jgi:manganese/zinc/iron transport system substrate-binding protein